MSTKPFRVSDEQGVRERNKAIQNREASLDIALREIMGTPTGRSWIWDLLSKCGVRRTPMRDSERMTHFALGEQNIGLQVEAQIQKVCPELYARAIQENGGESG